MGIRQSLGSKRILLTGATGFLGSALLERLITDIPTPKIYLVIRGDAPQKLKWLLAGSAFGPARASMGASDFDKLVSEKIEVIGADLAEGPPAIPDDVDLVIHSAATVSFDPPITEAFKTNLSGTTRLYQACRGLPFVHVSTAYVAGLTRGTQSEDLLERNVDWREELEAVLPLEAESDRASRDPELLEHFEAKARSDMGKAGPQSVARRAEELRRKWVTQRLVDAGRARARTLGWPDVYTLTKGLAELALDDLAGDNPLAIVRPSIIESALNRPSPGWVEGFRMTGPVILGYGRGSLPEFPGIPEGVVDVIPVDLVVNGVLAAAADMDQRRAVYHVCSGSRNPLKFREIYELAREYFQAHPLPSREGGTHDVPVWKFPGKRGVEKQLKFAERLIEGAERAVLKIPRGPLARRSAKKVDRFRRRFDFAKRYADLYGPYTQAEVIYTDNRAKALYESLDEQDRLDFPFDPTQFTWRHFYLDVQLPMLTAPLRWPAPGRSKPKVRIANGSAEQAASVIAAFDIEGTVVDSNVVEAYLWLRMNDAPDLATRAKRMADLAIEIPSLLRAEGRDRGEFLRQFYRRYMGVSAESIRWLARSVMGDLILRRLAPNAVARIREHRRAGHTIVFITGSLDFIIGPVVHLADVVNTALLSETDGIFNGDLQQPPLVGEARASWLRDFATDEGKDLEASYAYADSMSDLPMLEAVGNPVAVNPDVRLSRLASERRWPVEEWAASAGAPRLLFPSSEVRQPELSVDTNNVVRLRDIRQRVRS